MSTAVLENEQVTAELEKLDGWQLKDGKIYRRYEFSDFTHAFGFMTAVAIEAEKRNHHPEWSNVYNRVVVELITHDNASGSPAITSKDLELAGKIQDLARSFS